jgi:hypothetical protein
VRWAGSGLGVLIHVPLPSRARGHPMRLSPKKPTTTSATALRHFAGCGISALEPPARRFVCIRLVRSGVSLSARDNEGATAVLCVLRRGDAFLVGVLKREAAWMRRCVATVGWVFGAPERVAASGLGRRGSMGV